MDKQSLFNYIMTSPHNANPNVLETLIGESGPAIPNLIYYEATKEWQDYEATLVIENKTYEDIESEATDNVVLIHIIDESKNEEYYGIIKPLTDIMVLLGEDRTELYKNNNHNICAISLKYSTPGVIQFWLDDSEYGESSMDNQPLSYTELNELRQDNIAIQIYCDGATTNLDFYTKFPTKTSIFDSCFYAFTDEYFILIKPNNTITIEMLSNEYNIETDLTSFAISSASGNAILSKTELTYYTLKMDEVECDILNEEEFQFALPVDLTITKNNIYALVYPDNTEDPNRIYDCVQPTISNSSNKTYFTFANNVNDSASVKIIGYCEGQLRNWQ